MDSSMSVHMGSTTAGGGAELIAVATREREIAKHGELEHIEGKDKERSEACGKRKQCSISSCSKKSIDGSARFVERRYATGEIAFLDIKVQ